MIDDFVDAICFPASVSSSQACLCDACHRTARTAQLRLPFSKYFNGGPLSTEFMDYWLCPRCAGKLSAALDYLDWLPDDGTSAWDARMEAAE